VKNRVLHDSTDVAPMLVPHVPSGFLLLAVAGGHTTLGTKASGPIVRPGGQTTLRTEVGGPTACLGSLTAPRSEASGLTATPGSQPAWPSVVPSSSASPTSAAHDFGCATHVSGVLALPTVLLVSPSVCVGATSTASTLAAVADEGRTCGTSGQQSSNDHTSEAGLPADRLAL
jgi:hypothetical protein